MIECQWMAAADSRATLSLGEHMDVSRKPPVRGIIAALAFGTTWWLTLGTGTWPNGLRSLPSFLLVLLCVVGLDRIYSGVVDLVAIALRPHSRRMPTRE